MSLCNASDACVLDDGHAGTCSRRREPRSSRYEVESESRTQPVVLSDDRERALLAVVLDGDAPDVAAHRIRGMAAGIAGMLGYSDTPGEKWLLKIAAALRAPLVARAGLEEIDPYACRDAWRVLDKWREVAVADEKRRRPELTWKQADEQTPDPAKALKAALAIALRAPTPSGPLPIVSEEQP